MSMGGIIADDLNYHISNINKHQKECTPLTTKTESSRGFEIVFNIQ